MKLYFMKQSAIDYLKANMRNLYMNYFRYNTNEWIYDLFEYEPFEFFMEIPDFELAPISSAIGETELENCKILYTKLKQISESQASDERLWAGLCNDVFYKYVRARWGYSTLRSKNPEKDTTTVISRFFFSGGGRGGMFRNTLAKCWWVGKTTYDKDNTEHWALLDAVGSEDFATKVSDIFYSNTFAANPEILRGICEGLLFFRDKNQKLVTKEHVRPTMKYLNALGGGLLLDALSAEDICNIVIENIGRLKNGKQGDFIEEEMEAGIDANDEDISGEGSETPEVNVDYQEERTKLEQEVEGIDINEVLGCPQNVERGCTVTALKLSTNSEVIYNIPSLNEERELYTIEEKMLGKVVGDIIKINKDEYEIKTIRW
jgi:hypothetical protein